MTQIKAILLTGGNHIETVSFPCSDDEIMRLTEQNEVGHKATMTASSVRWWNASRCTPISTSRSFSAAGIPWKKRWNKQKSSLYRHKCRCRLLFFIHPIVKQDTLCLQAPQGHREQRRTVGSAKVLKKNSVKASRFRKQE